MPGAVPNFPFSRRGADLVAPITRAFRLRPVIVDDLELLLVGADFALDVVADFDTVHLAYVERSSSGELVVFGITPYLSERRFTVQDRAAFGEPTGRQEYLDASLRVIVSGLMNHATDVLRGARAWLAPLRAKDPARWAGARPDPRVVALLTPLLEIPRATLAS